jgi:Spy/CpxP family protein refolding chaperone
MKRSLALFAILGLLPMAQAQTPPTHTPPSPAAIAQREVQRYTTLLTLTPAQAEQATTFFTADATARENARTNERTAHQALETAVKSNDTATIQSTSAALGQIQSELTASHATARAQFYAILTAEQKTKFEQLEQEHMLGGPMHGPGMR